MINTIINLHTTKAANSQLHYRIGCAIAALCVGSLASPAFAANECGVPSGGSVTCAPNPGNYPGGITYVAPADITVNAPATVTVATAAPATNGITITGAQAATLAGAATVSTTGAGSNGVELTTGTGPAKVNVGDVSTSGALAKAVSATSISGSATITARSIRATGTGNSAAAATSDTGNASIVTTGDVVSSGRGNLGLIATSGTGNAAVTATNVSTVAADPATAALGGNAVLASGANATVVVTGTAATSGAAQPDVPIFSGDAVSAIATNGNAVITAQNASTLGAGARALTALATGGNATITANGTTSTRGINADGISAISTTGAARVTNTGNVTTTGDGSRGIYASGVTGAVVTSGNASATTGDAIVAVSSAGPATVTLTPGLVTSTTGNGVAITSATTATLNTAGGTTVNGGLNGAVLAGATGSTVNNAGTLQGRVYAVSASGGPATVNNSGMIRGAVALNGAGSTFNNNGTFDAAGGSSFGAGSVLNNVGLIRVRSIGAVPGTATLTGLGTLSNTGLIDLRSGAIGNTLTTTGNYVGSGNARLAVRVAPGAAIAADQLIVGGSATGSTRVAFDLAPGAQPLFNTGSTIVQAGTGSAAGAFSVDPAGQSIGLVRYDVVFNPATSDYALVAGPSDAAYHTLGYQNALRNMWYKSADAVTTELRTKRDTLWNMGGTAPSGRFWLSMGASAENTRGYRGFGTLGQTNLTDTAARQDFFGGQIGLDLTGGVSDRGGFAVGITGGFIHSITDLGNSTDNFRINGANGGIYASFTQGNVFATVLGKYDHYWARAQSQTAGFSERLSGHSYGVRGELGTRFGSNSFFMEPVAQLSWIRSTLDPFAVRGTRVEFNERDGLRGKLGARIGGNTGIGNGARMAFYAGGNYVHEFKGQDRVTFSNLGGSFTVDGQKHRDYGEAIVGFNIAAPGSATTYFMEGTYEHSFGGSGNGQFTQEGYGGRAGIRFKL